MRFRVQFPTFVLFRTHSSQHDKLLLGGTSRGCFDDWKHLFSLLINRLIILSPIGFISCNMLIFFWMSRARLQVDLWSHSQQFNPFSHKMPFSPFQVSRVKLQVDLWSLISLTAVQSLLRRGHSACALERGGLGHGDPPSEEYNYDLKIQTRNVKHHDPWSLQKPCSFLIQIRSNDNAEKLIFLLHTSVVVEMKLMWNSLSHTILNLFMR